MRIRFSLFITMVLFFTVVFVNAQDDTCYLGSKYLSSYVNMRTGPDVSFPVEGEKGKLWSGDQIEAVGQTTGIDGFIWYETETGLWARDDVTSTEGNCSGLPNVEAQALPETTDVTEIVVPRPASCEPIHSSHDPNDGVWEVTGPGNGTHYFPGESEERFILQHDGTSWLFGGGSFWQYPLGCTEEMIADYIGINLPEMDMTDWNRISALLAPQPVVTSTSSSGGGNNNGGGTGGGGSTTPIASGSVASPGDPWPSCAGVLCNISYWNTGVPDCKRQSSDMSSFTGAGSWWAYDNAAAANAAFANMGLPVC